MECRMPVKKRRRGHSSDEENGDEEDALEILEERNIAWLKKRKFSARTGTQIRDNGSDSSRGSDDGRKHKGKNWDALERGKISVDEWDPEKDFENLQDLDWEREPEKRVEEPSYVPTSLPQRRVSLFQQRLLERKRNGTGERTPDNKAKPNESRVDGASTLRQTHFPQPRTTTAFRPTTFYNQDSISIEGLEHFDRKANPPVQSEATSYHPFENTFDQSTSVLSLISMRDLPTTASPRNQVNKKNLSTPFVLTFF